MFDKNYPLPADALNRIMDALQDLQPLTEMCPIEESYGRVLAADIVSPEDLPAFPRSTVDGYAVRAEDKLCAENRFWGCRGLMPGKQSMSDYFKMW